MADGTAPIGHNRPPEPSPFEAISVHICDLYDQAKGWLDGEPVASEEHAEKVALLLDMIREAEKAADAARVEENRPFDEGKAAVQAKYAPLIGNTKSVKGKTVLASEACKAALKPWREAQEAQRRAEAERARQEAEEAARAAAEAARAAQADDLSAQEQADAAMRQAEQTAKAAKKADRAADTGNGLRSYFSPVLADGVAAARHYWVERRPECEAFFLSLAQADVRAGKRSIPGFDVIEERRAI